MQDKMVKGKNIWQNHMLQKEFSNLSECLQNVFREKACKWMVLTNNVHVLFHTPFEIAMIILLWYIVSYVLISKSRTFFSFKNFQIDDTSTHLHDLHIGLSESLASKENMCAKSVKCELIIFWSKPHLGP